MWAQRGQQLLIVALLLPCAVAALGCASTPRNASLSSIIDTELVAHDLEREEHLKLGRLSLGFVRGLLRIAGDDLDENDAAVVRSLRRIEVSTYAIEPPLRPGQDLPMARVEDSLSDRGWSRMIRTADDDERVMLLTHSNRGGEIDGIFVLSADRHEVELVRLEGALDEFLARAIADDPDFARGLLGS